MYVANSVPYDIDNLLLCGALSKVKDGKQILVDIIPVGEVYYK